MPSIVTIEDDRKEFLVLAVSFIKLLGDDRSFPLCAEALISSAMSSKPTIIYLSSHDEYKMRPFNVIHHPARPTLGW